ncbi:hypothetical protein C8J57DRAFT_1250754 [Mycena rebaudengoi]|nr:hypothetical protein C8J57DRAFT_1250754 [Mycena rebaudengoi]
MAMPESQVLNAFAHRIHLTLEDACCKNGGLWPEDPFTLLFGVNALPSLLDILEANMLMLSKADFDKMVSTCVQGNNKNLAKAKRPRLFPLPQSSHCELQSYPSAHNIQPGSLLWETCLWKWFQSGPDWIVETDTALAGLDS